MKQRRWSRALLPLAVLFLLATSLEAQFGRVEFTVTDTDGNILQGVKVTATTPELGRFRQEKITNKRGQASISVVDATKTYDFSFEHPDFAPQQRTVKLTLGDTVRIPIEMSKTVLVPAPADSRLEVTFSPAETAFNEGVEAMRAGEVEAARGRFEESLSLDPSLSAAHSALARVLLQLERYPEAVRHAEQYLASDVKETDPSIHRVLYYAHRAMGNEAEAEKARNALSASEDPAELATLLYNEGVAALRLGADDDAEARFKEAEELDPSLTAVTKALAILYGRRGMWTEAAGASEKYLASDPTDPPVLRIRWEAYRALGDAANEQRAREALAAKDPDQLTEEFTRQGLELFNAGKTEEAAEAFERALSFNPDAPRAHYQLGLCHLNAGRSAEAKRHLQRFIELSPDDPEVPAAKEMLSFL